MNIPDRSNAQPTAIARFAYQNMCRTASVVHIAGPTNFLNIPYQLVEAKPETLVSSARSISEKIIRENGRLLPTAVVFCKEDPHTGEETSPVYMITAKNASDDAKYMLRSLAQATAFLGKALGTVFFSEMVTARSSQFDPSTKVDLLTVPGHSFLVLAIIEHQAFPLGYEWHTCPMTFDADENRVLGEWKKEDPTDFQSPFLGLLAHTPELSDLTSVAYKA